MRNRCWTQALTQAPQPLHLSRSTVTFPSLHGQGPPKVQASTQGAGAYAAVGTLLGRRPLSTAVWQEAPPSAGPSLRPYRRTGERPSHPWPGRVPPPVRARMASTSLGTGGTSVGRGPVGDGAAHCAQVESRSPRGRHSPGKRMVRMSAASWLDDIQIHFLLLSLTLMEFLVAMGNRIHGHYVPLQAECQPKATNFLVFILKLPKFASPLCVFLITPGHPLPAALPGILTGDVGCGRVIFIHRTRLRRDRCAQGFSVRLCQAPRPHHRPKLYTHLVLVATVELPQGTILDADCTMATQLGREFIRELLTGYDPAPGPPCH